MSCTTPKWPCASMRSPILKGLNKMINAPPAKLLRAPCNAKPMAKPAAPIMAANDVVSIPSLEATVTMSKTFNAQLIRLLKNFDKDSSSLRLLKMRLTNPVIKLMAIQPKINIAKAANYLWTEINNNRLYFIYVLFHFTCIEAQIYQKVKKIYGYYSFRFHNPLSTFLNHY